MNYVMTGARRVTGAQSKGLDGEAGGRSGGV